MDITDGTVVVTTHEHYCTGINRYYRQARPKKYSLLDIEAFCHDDRTARYNVVYHVL